MRHRGSLIIATVIVVVAAAGCARRPAPDAMMPDASPPPGAVEEEPAYLAAAKAFVSAIQQGNPEQAWELLTDEAKKTLPAEQFNRQMGELRPSGYHVVTHVATEQAAYVLVGFESAEAVAPEATQMPASGLGLLLRPTEEDRWRVSFFVPQSDKDVGPDDLALSKTGEHQFTLTWTSDEGASRSLTMTEF